MSDLERRLVDLFAADAAGRRVARVRRSSPGPLSLAFSAAGVATTIVLALWAGNAIADRRAAAPPTPAPSATAPAVIASPAPSAAVSPTPSSVPSPTPATSTPAAIPAREYGYVFTDQPSQPCTSGCKIIVRRERDGSTAFELDGVLPAVSPDGRLLAYWRTTPNVGPTDLRVVDVGDPRSDRSVLTLTGRTLGGPMVWSAMYPALLVVTESAERSGGAGGGHCPANTTLLTIDLTVDPPATRSTVRSGGCVYIPLAWSAFGSTAAVIGTGPGGYATEYVLWDTRANTLSSTPFTGLVIASTARASTDASGFAILEADSPTVRVYRSTRDLTLVERYAQPARVAELLWRPAQPAHYEIVWSNGQRVEVFSHPPGTVATLLTSRANALAIRPDGSAVLLAEGPEPTRFTVLDLATRRTAEMMVAPGPVGVTRTVLPRGVILR